MCAHQQEVSTVALQEKSKEELASVGYHYRIWDLGGIEIAVRCEVDAVMQRQGEEHLLCTRTFNQAVLSASDVDWKRKLEHQSAAVLAMEVKNNSNRVARWTLSALLAGCDLMKARLHSSRYRASLRACSLYSHVLLLNTNVPTSLACTPSLLAGARVPVLPVAQQLCNIIAARHKSVRCEQIGLAARVSPKDNTSHVLLATSQQKPRDLAGQLNIKMTNCWAVVRYMIDLCFKLEKDNYILMKDPNKQLMYLYEVPSSVTAANVDDDEEEPQGTPLPA